MIDVENYIVNIVNDRLKEEIPDVQVHSSHIRSPSVFPCVMIYESDSVTYDAIRFGDGIERYVEVRYTVEVCTNDQNGKKEKAKRISKVVDDVMQGMGFYRTARQYTFGTNESAIFVALSAYRGLVGESPSGEENEFIVYRR